MDWSRRSVLGGLAAMPCMARAVQAHPETALMVVYADGGWDPTFVVDPAAARTSVDGPELDEDPSVSGDLETLQHASGLSFMSNPIKRPAVDTFYAKHAQRLLVVNGLSIGEISHPRGRQRVMTGGVDPLAPDLGAIAGLYAPSSCALPYVDLSGFAHPGVFHGVMTRLGRRQQLGALLRPSGIDDGVQRKIGERDRTRLDAWWQERNAALRAERSDMRGSLEAWAEARATAASWRSNDDLNHALTPGPRLRLRGQVDTALNLIERGLTRSVMLATTQSWDTHDDVSRQHASWDSFFDDFGYLVDMLIAKGLLQRTLVVVLSDLGRAPRRNGRNGKDHWPVSSALLLGAGVRGGRTVGATDAKLQAEAVQLATGRLSPYGVLPSAAHLFAGVLWSLGIDPGPWGAEVDPLLFT